MPTYSVMVTRKIMETREFVFTTETEEEAREPGRRGLQPGRTPRTQRVGAGQRGIRVVRARIADCALG